MAVSAADKKKLGKWIKQAREKKQPHLSQRQLALAVDITNASLSSIESGMIFPSEELLLKLIEQLQPPPITISFGWKPSIRLGFFPSHT